MTKERFYIEINDKNAIYDKNTLIIKLPYNQQSCEGVDFYFSEDFIKDKNLIVESVSIYPSPLKCYWNWLMTSWGTSAYDVYPEDDSIDISKYIEPNISGSFGFSGYMDNEEDITITFKLKNIN